MTLADFFAPLTWQVTMMIGGLFLAWDIMGAGWAQLLRLSKTWRPAYWIFGLGGYVFFWFLAHFFIPFLPTYTWVSLVVMAILGLPFYLRTKAWQPLIEFCVKYPAVPLLLVVLGFVKPLFYHASLPPRVWDDMAYHFYPPYQIFTEKVWDFTSNMITGELSFYGMLPRFVDTAYVLGFSLTRTYATAQVIHLGLLLTAIWTTSIFLSRRIGYLSGVVFAWLCLGLNTGIVLSATTGYVDAAAGALALLVLVAVGEWLVVGSAPNVLAIAAAAGMAVGTKYTNIIFPVVSFGAATVLQSSSRWKQFRHLFELKAGISALKTGALWLILMVLVGGCFGGYWYIKNLTLSGNPFYPFLLGCNGCQEEQNVLDNWGYARFTQENQELITNALFYKTPELYALFFIAASLAVWSGVWLKQSAPIKLVVLIFMGVICEIFIVRLISPFELRFFYHWQLFIPLILSLPFVRLRHPWGHQQNAFIVAIWLAYASLLVTVVKPLIATNLESTTDVEAISSHNRAYALGVINFEQWFAPMMPRAASVVHWCGEVHDPVVELYVADPELIWNYEGLSRAFLVNCRFQLIHDPQTKPLEVIMQQLKAQPHDTYIFSAVSCGQTGLVYKDPLMIKLAEINQQLICNSTQIGPLLYQLQK